MSESLRVTSMDHINMRVKSIDETIRFYRDLFGFEVRKEDNQNKGGMPSKIIGNDSVKLCIYEDPGMSPEGGIAHFGFHVEDFGRIIETCGRLGVEVLYGGPVEFEGSRSVYIRDPSGYDIELSSVPGGGL